MTKGQIKLGTIEKRVEFIEMQTAEDISNIDKIYKILERLEKRLDLLQPPEIIVKPTYDEEIVGIFKEKDGVLSRVDYKEQKE